MLLERVQRRTGPPIWLFSSLTVRETPSAFQEIDDFTNHLPLALTSIKIFSIPLWRWIAILFSVGLLLFLFFSLLGAVSPLLRVLGRRLPGGRSGGTLSSLRHPLVMILLAIIVQILAHYAVSLLGRQVWSKIAGLLAIVGIAWLVIAIANIISQLVIRGFLVTQASDKIAIALIRRSFSILVIVIALIVLLHDAGVNVTAMLAGLGIGGVALALAAQKTLENFFGGIAIMMREVVRVGDFCKIADQIGTVEDVGFSSTRIRTLERAVVSVSNAQVSQTSIENYTMRDKIWFHQIFGLASQTSPEQMRRVLADVTNMLRGHPKVEGETSRIRLITFGKESLDVEVYAYIKETDFARFLEVQEELLLRIMDIIATNGVYVATPSQLTRVDRERRVASGDQEGRLLADDRQKLHPKSELAR